MEGGMKKAVAPARIVAVQGPQNGPALNTWMSRTLNLT